MKIAIAQINCTVGDIAGNMQKIAQFARNAQAAGASLVLTPELSLSGYPPEDLLLREDFNLACESALLALAEAVPDITLIVGHPRKHFDTCYNAASVLQDGQILATYHKQELPNHSVFDEVRYFSAGNQPLVLTHKGVNFGVLICADIWEVEPARQARLAGAQVLLVLNASPFHQEKQVERHAIIRQRVQDTGLPVIYANLIGGQDELVFDGGSFVFSRHGVLTHQAPAFKETLTLVELVNGDPLPAEISAPLALEDSVYQALCLGLHDYIRKNAFPGVLLGLSGGIDSALTLAIAVDTLGAEHVQAIMMPSAYTADISVNDSRDMVKRLGVKYREFPITSVFESFRATLATEFEGLPFDATEENLQARIRGTLLMAVSNKFGAIVITTGNKSEMAVGYATLYGDMVGGFALLKDVPKTLVYRLAGYRNSISPVIPQRIIDRPPSAELRPNQTDQDSLPPYNILDAIIEAYVEYDLGFQDIVAMGFEQSVVERVIKLINRNEYKRSQSAVGVRISRRGFGKDRRYPITANFKFF